MPGVQAVAPAIYITVLLSSGQSRARGGGEGHRSGARSEAQRGAATDRFGSADFTPDADGFDAVVVGKMLAEEMQLRAGRLRHADQPCRATDAVRHGAAIAAIPRHRNFRFRLLRLRRELGIRHAGRGAEPGRRRRRGQRAGISHRGRRSRRGNGRSTAHEAGPGYWPRPGWTKIARCFARCAWRNW